MITGLPSVPCLVVINITPLAPFIPYTAQDEASFKIVTDSISDASIRAISRSTPSTNTNGVLAPL